MNKFLTLEIVIHMIRLDGASHITLPEIIVEVDCMVPFSI